MSRFLFGPISKMNGGGARGRVANRNLITAEQIELRQRLENVNAPANNVIEPPIPPSSPPATGGNSTDGVNINAMPVGDGTYQMSTDPNAIIPILYGQCQVRGSVFDAELTSNGQVLTTALMLSERTGAGLTGNADYTLNEVYFNDAKLNLHANGKVANAVLNNGNISTKYNTNTEVFLYQGNVFTKIDEIQPGVTPTYGLASDLMQNWSPLTASTSRLQQGVVSLNGSVFALIKQTYDAANGVQGLGTWTFDITNQTASNPGDVMYDYLTNERYGAQYDANTINSNTLVGAETTSLKSISNETRLFTTSIAADGLIRGPANISNATQYPQVVTNGLAGDSSLSGLTIASSLNNFGFTDPQSNVVKANVRFAGNNFQNFGGNSSKDFSNNMCRFKIFWANAASQNLECTNIISGNSTTSPNTFTGFLDIARLVPDGSNINLFNWDTGNSSVAEDGKMFPGDEYIFQAVSWGRVGVEGYDTVTIDSGITPTATITNLLVEGDKIRPEGSPYVYTVASNVSVTGAGYKQFSIPVKEKIVVPDFANISSQLSNTSFGGPLNVQPFTQSTTSNRDARRFQISSDEVGIFYNPGGWPFANADVTTATRFPGTANMTQHANVIFSNVLVGNAVMTSPSIANDNIRMGEETNMTINGLVKTDKTVQDIQKQILKHSGSMLNWELPEGRWKAIPNANANISGAKVFNDDNIVGEIKVTTSDISTYYNSARAQYVEKNHNSVKEDIIVYTPNFELNTNESKHKMELNYPLCDSASEAQRKADVELKQNRLDKVINFKSDFTGIGVEPGDIIKVTNTDYGFTDKTFRAVRVRETMDDDILMLNITAIEWSNETYTDRIPFRKPALDDIEFEPEEYQDIIDAKAIPALDSTIDQALANASITTTFANSSYTGTPNFGSTNEISLGNVSWTTAAGTLQHKPGKYVAIAHDQSSYALAINSFSDPVLTHAFFKGTTLKITVVNPSGSTVYTETFTGGSAGANFIDGFFRTDTVTPWTLSADATEVHMEVLSFATTGDSGATGAFEYYVTSVSED